MICAGCGLKIGGRLIPELHNPRNQTVVFADEKHQLTVTYPNGVPVTQQLSPHGYAVDEGPIVAIQVNQVEGGVGFADCEMLSRYRAVVEAQMVGRLAPHGELAPRQAHYRTFR